MPTTYTEEFKKATIEKVLKRGSKTMDEVLPELGGVCKATVARWIKESAKVPELMPNKEKSSRDWNALEKFQAVVGFENQKDNPEKQGEFLRRTGLHASVVERWRKEVVQALGKSTLRRPKRSPEEVVKDRKIADLERDLRRKDKALAETAALLILKKKAESMWGLVDDEDK